MKIPEDTRSVNPDLVVGYRRPRSTIEAEKYAFKAAEKGHERQMQQFENDRIARTINFVGNLTKAGGEFVNKLIENEAARQVENAEVMVDKGFYDIKKDLADNPYEQQDVIGAGGIAPGFKGPQTMILRHDKVWGEAKEKIKDEVLKTLTNPRAKKLFETRYEGIAQKFGQELQNDARTIMRNQQKVDSNNNIEYWVSKGRMDKVNELIAAGRATGLYKPEEIDTITDNARTAIAYGITKSVASSLPFEQSIQFLNSPEQINKLLEKNGLSGSDFTEETKNKIEEELQEDHDFALAKVAEAEKQHQEQLDNQALEAVMTDKATFADFREGGRFAGLERDRKEHYYNVLLKDSEEAAPENNEGALYLEALDDYDAGKLVLKDLQESGKYYDLTTPHNEKLRGMLRKKKEDAMEDLKKAREDAEKKKEIAIKSDDATIDKIISMEIDPDIEAKELRNFIFDARSEGLLNKTDFKMYIDRVSKKKPNIVLKESLDTIDSHFKDEQEDAESKEKIELEKEKIQLKKYIAEQAEKNDWTDEQILQAIDNNLNPRKRKFVSKILDKMSFGRLGESEEEYQARMAKEGKTFGVKGETAPIQTVSNDFMKFKGEKPETIRVNNEGIKAYLLKGIWYAFIDNKWKQFNKAKGQWVETKQ